MFATGRMKSAFIALLFAALILGDGTPTDGRTIALLFFGVLNVVFSPPGTGWVRTAATVGVAAALVWDDLFTTVALLAWVVWPPAYMVGWATARERDEADEAARHRAASGPRLAVAAVIGAVTIASLMYRSLVGNGLDQTAALFVGVPAILAIIVVLATSPRSAAGVACKAVTVGLLVSLLFLWEGILCVAMSAPLFYLIALVIAQMVTHSRSESQKPQAWLSCLGLLAIVPMSLEGVSDRTSFNRHEEVSETKVVRASAADVARAITAPPRFDRSLPLYLRIGFPRPVSTRIEHGSGSSRWVIRFRGGEMKLNGMEPRAGDLVLEMAESGPGFVRWRAVGDESHMTHFLAWREAAVRWEPIGPGETRVTWMLRYRRGLDPAWYFGPWERYAVGLAAGYLIDAVATP